MKSTILAGIVGLLATPGLTGEEPAPLIAIGNAATPLSGVLTGGQPTRAQIDEAAAAGFGTVINLRTAAEKGFEWEPEAIDAAGMRYVHLPVGADGLTRETVERFDSALTEGLAEGPVLVHCASGNRVGALFALRAAWLQGATAEEALELGRKAGLSRMEPRVVELLTQD